MAKKKAAAKKTVTVKKKPQKPVKDKLTPLRPISYPGQPEILSETVDPEEFIDYSAIAQQEDEWFNTLSDLDFQALSAEAERDYGVASLAQEEKQRAGSTTDAMIARGIFRSGARANALADIKADASRRADALKAAAEAARKRYNDTKSRIAQVSKPAFMQGVNAAAVQQADQFNADRKVLQPARPASTSWVNPKSGQITGGPKPQRLPNEPGSAPKRPQKITLTRPKKRTTSGKGAMSANPGGRR